jgi:hypothetical protein
MKLRSNKDEKGSEQTKTCREKKYQERIDKIGTLDNGRVSVRVSSLAAPVPMMGLFANQKFEVGEVVTTYGGQLRSVHDARSESARLHTHTRRIPESDFVRDGKAWSERFRLSFPLKEQLQEMKRPAGKRTHLFPTNDHKKKEQDGKAEDILNTFIRTTGIGYMANTGPRKQLNVKVINLSVDKFGLEPCEMFYVASKSIQPDDEILVAYNWGKLLL